MRCNELTPHSARDAVRSRSSFVAWIALRKRTRFGNVDYNQLDIDSIFWVPAQAGATRAFNDASPCFSFAALSLAVPSLVVLLFIVLLLRIAKAARGCRAA